MPSLSDNKQEWDVTYTWERGGDEWSDPWGGARAQWSGSILPRIFPFLDRGRILEIAPGYGRWTQFLKDHCDSLVAVDLSPQCIAQCKSRFEGCKHVECFANDGKTFPMVEDGSISFVFSFDALVHAEADVLESYVHELSLKLRPGAVGFLHHSNLGGVRRSLTNEIRRRLLGVPFDSGWRASSMSAELMRLFCKRNGMSCVQQEIMPWVSSGPYPIDCLSTFVNVPDLATVAFQNDRFMEEARAVKRVATL